MPVFAMKTNNQKSRTESFPKRFWISYSAQAYSTPQQVLHSFTKIWWKIYGMGQEKLWSKFSHCSTEIFLIHKWNLLLKWSTLNKETFWMAWCIKKKKLHLVLSNVAYILQIKQFPRLDLIFTMKFTLPINSTSFNHGRSSVPPWKARANG